MVKRIREANHTIVNSGMYRTRALCTRQKFSLYLQTSHGSRKNKIHSGHKGTWRLRFMGVLPMQGRRRRIPQHSRLRPRLQDTKPGPRAGEIGTKEKTRASLMPLASGSHASGSANEIACSAPRRTRSVLFLLVLPFAGGSRYAASPQNPNPKFWGTGGTKYRGGIEAATCGGGSDGGEAGDLEHPEEPEGEESLSVAALGSSVAVDWLASHGVSVFVWRRRSLCSAARLRRRSRRRPRWRYRRRWWRRRVEASARQRRSLGSGMEIESFLFFSFFPAVILDQHGSGDLEFWDFMGSSFQYT